MTTPLDRLSLIQSQIDALAVERHRVVVEARTAGASWAAIAQRLGVTKQAAHRRFKERPADVEQLPLSDPLFGPLFQTPQD